MPGAPTYIQSLTPSAAKPVATTIRDYGTADTRSLAIQHMIVTDAASDVQLTVRSYAAGNPMAVALTGTDGAHLTNLSVTASVTGIPAVVGSVLAVQEGTWTVAQGGAPWSTVTSVIGQPTTTVSVAGVPQVVGSVGVSQLGTWTTVASVIGQPTVTASVVGQLTATASIVGIPTVVGSVGASQLGTWTVQQGTAPWTVIASCVGQLTATASIVGAPTVIASVIGQPTVIASVVGQSTVTASVVGIPTVVGSVGASQLGTWTVQQGGAPWTVIASCVGQQTVTASLIGVPTITASVIGQPTVTASIIGSVPVTQATTPWLVVASIVGGGSTVTGSVNATQVGSWGVLAYAAMGDPAGGAMSVRSWASGPLLRVSLEQGTLSAGADGALLDFDNANIGATVTSLATGQKVVNVAIVSSGGVRTTVASDVLGGLLNVNIARGTINLSGADGAIQDGADATIEATVLSYAVGKPLAVALTDTTGAHVPGVTVTGSVLATQGGAPWTVVASVIGQVTATVSVAGIPAIVGSVGASQLGTWTVVASVIGQPTVTASLIGVPTVVASVIGQPTVTASVIGQVTTTASVAGIPTVIGSVQVQGQVAHDAAMAGNPVIAGAFALDVLSGSPTAVGSGDAVRLWSNPTGELYTRATVVGSVLAVQQGTWTVAQGTPPWTVVASCIGQVTVTASVIGVPTVVSSVIGQPTVTASVIGQVTVTASCIGQQTVTASVAGIPQVVGSVGATQLGTWTVAQGGAPWTVVASVIGQPTVTASLIGVPTVVASVIGNVAVTASLAGVGTIVGSVGVTQISSPWITQKTQTGSHTYESHELTIQGSLFNMSFTTSLGLTHAASCSCTRSAFSRVPTARALTIRNVGAIAAKFRFNTTSADLVTVDPGETLTWDVLALTEFYVTVTTVSALRVSMTPVP